MRRITNILAQTLLLFGGVWFAYPHLSLAQSVLPQRVATLTSEAEACRKQGDYVCCIAKYETITKAYPAAAAQVAANLERCRSLREQQLASARPEPRPKQLVATKPGYLLFLPDIRSILFLVRGGTFRMGDDTSGETDERPAHEVRVSDFYMGEHEVTQAQWREVMGTDPEELYNTNCPTCPVEGVSFKDVAAFLKKLNEREGRSGARAFRLPTEAEWEYAARGGKNWRDGYTYSGGNYLNKLGWYDDNYQKSKHGDEGTTHPVGRLAPNQLGNHRDLSGNVWEWCSDWYAEDWYNQAASRQSNPENKAYGPKEYRVLRGGSWFNNATCARVVYRYYGDPDEGYGSVGFRIVVSEF